MIPANERCGKCGRRFTGKNGEGHDHRVERLADGTEVVERWCHSCGCFWASQYVVETLKGANAPPPIRMIDARDESGYWSAEDALIHALDVVRREPRFSQVIVTLKDPVSGEMQDVLARVRCTEGIGMLHRTIDQLLQEVSRGGG